MAALNELLSFLEGELHSEPYADSSMNGLQFQGRAEVRRVGSAVDSGVAVIEKAAAAHCDLLIVHHGLFWGGPIAITGSHRTLVGLLCHRDMSLFASHIPLDAHPQFGNNAVLGRFVGLENLIPSIEHHGKKIGFVGENSANYSIEDLVSKLAKLPGSREVFNLNFGPKTPKRVCVVTGAGADSLWSAKKDNFDTLITGEPRQSMFHFAKENHLNVICAGHYATETVGVRAIGDELERRFGVEHFFIDEPTGI